MNGSLYHVLPPVCAGSDQQPHFMQVYMIDGHERQVEACMQANGYNDELDKRVVSMIQGFLNEHNPYIQKFCMIRQQLSSTNSSVEEAILQIVNKSRRGAAPVRPELAFFIPDLSVNINVFHDVRVQNRDGSFFCINKNNAMYGPLHYVLMFPYGDVGYSFVIHEKQFTMLLFYQHLLQIRS